MKIISQSNRIKICFVCVFFLLQFIPIKIIYAADGCDYDTDGSDSITKYTGFGDYYYADGDPSYTDEHHEGTLRMKCITDIHSNGLFLRFRLLLICKTVSNGQEPGGDFEPFDSPQVVNLTWDVSINDEGWPSDIDFENSSGTEIHGPNGYWWNKEIYAQTLAPGDVDECGDLVANGYLTAKFMCAGETVELSISVSNWHPISTCPNPPLTDFELVIFLGPFVLAVSIVIMVFHKKFKNPMK